MWPFVYGQTQKDRGRHFGVDFQTGSNLNCLSCFRRPESEFLCTIVQSVPSTNTGGKVSSLDTLRPSHNREVASEKVSTEIVTKDYDDLYENHLVGRRTKALKILRQAGINSFL